MQLYFTDLGALSRQLPLNDLSVNVAPGALDMAELAGLIDGMPFILMDDGSYDLDLNRFFRACPSMGARSPNTWRSYARDILVWARFLTERRDGKTVWQADRHDVLAFHRARRLSSVPYRISAASRNRSVAALDKLYRWAVEEGIIAASPFSYDVVTGGGFPRKVGGENRTVTAGRRPWWPRMAGLQPLSIGIGGHLATPPTGSPEAVARPRLPQNVACRFPALRSSEVGSQHSDRL